MSETFEPFWRLAIDLYSGERLQPLRYSGMVRARDHRGRTRNVWSCQHDMREHTHSAQDAALACALARAIHLNQEGRALADLSPLKGREV